MKQEMDNELTEFAALAYLNRRTPHRYTGLFRFEGDILRNEVLVDGNQPLVRQGDDIPLAATFCSLVGRQQAPLEILDAATDTQFGGLVDTPVHIVACLFAMRRATHTARCATTTCSGARSERPTNR